MSGARFKITGVGLWMSGTASAEAWAGGDIASEEAVKPKGHGLDKRNKRRASQHARALADVYHEALTQAGADPETVATVFGSSLGEAGTMIKLLEQIHREKTSPSPMAFAMSVHNAASGLVSIGGKNRGFTTSIAADYDTPAMALAEGFGLAERFKVPVIVAVADEDAPRDLVPDNELFDAVAAAVCIEAMDSETQPLAVVEGPLPLSVGKATLAGAETDELHGRSPATGMLDLVDAVQRGKRGVLRLDRGRGRGWCVELLDA